MKKKKSLQIKFKKPKTFCIELEHTAHALILVFMETYNTFSRKVKMNVCQKRSVNLEMRCKSGNIREMISTESI